MDRFALCCLPTPCHRLERLNLGVELWIKRDDLTGFALGGNKGRKLEYLLAGWLSRGVQAVVSCGASDSNFIRQLSVAGRMTGIEVHAAVMDLPFDSAAGRPKGGSTNRGNERLSIESGAHLTKQEDGDWEDLYASMEAICRDLRSQGVIAEEVPVGGSSPEGINAFIQAAGELNEPFDTIVVASSSGSTQVGLTTAFHGTSTKVIGISADPEPTLVDDFAELSKRYVGTFGGRALLPSDFNLDLRFVGPGYGVPSQEGGAASSLMLKAQGIYLDPIYSAKAFAGLLRLAEEGQLGRRALFWHTGGMPSLFTEFE